MQLQVIQTKIYEIRGHKVMLDFDLAELYEVETRINVITNCDDINKRVIERQMNMQLERKSMRLARMYVNAMPKPAYRTGRQSDRSTRLITGLLRHYIKK
jgi:hypothetical protein